MADDTCPTKKGRRKFKYKNSSCVGSERDLKNNTAGSLSENTLINGGAGRSLRDKSSPGGGAERDLRNKMESDLSNTGT